MPLRLLLLAVIAPAPALSTAAPPVALSAPSAFRPDLFFAGRTRGSGTVRMATSSRPRVLAVEGTGRIDASGTLDLEQAVTLDGKTSQRRFRIRRAPDGGWRGTLTDAAGPVRGTVQGNRMTLDYGMRRGGMHMRQTLDLQPGGRVVLNRATVTLLGITVARVEETIEKLD